MSGTAARRRPEPSWRRPSRTESATRSARRRRARAERAAADSLRGRPALARLGAGTRERARAPRGRKERERGERRTEYCFASEYKRDWGESSAGRPTDFSSVEPSRPRLSFVWGQRSRAPPCYSYKAEPALSYRAGGGSDGEARRFGQVHVPACLAAERRARRAAAARAAPTARAIGRATHAAIGERRFSPFGALWKTFTG